MRTVSSVFACAVGFVPGLVVAAAALFVGAVARSPRSVVAVVVVVVVVLVVLRRGKKWRLGGGVGRVQVGVGGGPIW